MKLVEILQGKWLGHPLHPALVHVPVGAWTVACVADLVGWFRGPTDTMSGLAEIAVALGLVVACAAIPTGVAEWLPIKKGRPAWTLALWHLVFNGVATLLWIVNLILRLRSAGELTIAILGTSVAGTVVLFIGAYLGTLLVFDRGISVARQSKKQWRELAVRGGARVPDSK